MKAVTLSRRAVLAAALGTAGVALAGEDRRAARAIFVSHLSPRLAIDPVRGPKLRAWGEAIETPRAILAMTPHFGERRLTIGSTKKGFGRYDFPRFMKRELPPDLDYPSPPSEELARRVEALLPGKTRRDLDRDGFDHTTWMPLFHMFPRADVPVLELSYPYVSERELFDLGRALAPLSREGVMFFASGGLTHNLASVDLSSDAIAKTTPDWSREFDAWASEAMAKRDVDAMIDWRAKAPASRLAHPDDGGHYRVLLAALGYVDGAARASSPLADFQSTMSARCFELD